jgi:hypothetical protein
MGREVVSKQKIIFDHLGNSQKFLKILLDLGTAASEVRSDGVEKGSLAQYVKAASHFQSYSWFYQCPLSGNTIISIDVTRLVNLCSAA